jgi:hypothetical protein
MRRFLVGGVVSVLLLSGSQLAWAEEGQPSEYTGAEFQSLYEYAVANTLPNLKAPNGRYNITGSSDLDGRIWELAFERGYVLRPTAAGDLGSADGVTMQPQAAEAWRTLKADARAAGMSFIVSSAYRSPAAQRTQFNSKLGGTSDSAINTALTWWSIPGTSKHHGGYALDFRYRSGTFGDFRSTRDYQWLQANNFSVALSHGFVPSYPDDVATQGPNPEPWEFLWIGTGLIQCGIPQPLISLPGPAAAILLDVGKCPGGMERAQPPLWLVSL